MAYWGLARCGMNWSTGLGDYPEIKRYNDFLNEAVRRKDTVSERERLHIEVWDEAMVEKSKAGPRKPFSAGRQN